MSEQTVLAPAATPASFTDEIATLVQAGKAALEQGDLDGALARFEAVIRRFPDSAEAHNNLGALYAALARHREAEACFSRVHALLPDNANVLYNRGIVRLRAGDADGALADFEAVVRLRPEDADAWNNLGVAHHLRGESAAAAANFRQALALQPDALNTVLNLADAEEAAGRPGAGAAACADLLAIRDDPVVRRRLCELLAAEATLVLGRVDTTATALLGLDPDDRAAWALRERVRAANAALAAAPPAGAPPAAG